MSTEGGGASRAGGEGHNEDVFVVDESLGLYVVCDGAGAQPAGEIAAKLAAEAVKEFIERRGDEDPSIVRAAGETSPRLLANRIVRAAHREDSEVDAIAVVSRICGEAEPGWLELSVPPRSTAFGHTLEYA